MLSHAARVVRVEAENEHTRTLTLDTTLSSARPGQVLMVWLPGENEKPLSLMNATSVQLTVAAVGPFARAMHQLRPDDRV